MTVEAHERPRVRNHIAIPRRTLDLDHTFDSGQVFRWRRDVKGAWIGNCGGILLHLSHENDGVTIRGDRRDDPIAAARRFLRTDVNLDALVQSWSAVALPGIAEAATAFPGLRVLRQDPIECIFSFLTSPAAPIYRIRRCLEGLCRELGTNIGRLDAHEVYSFPSLDSLAAAPSELLDRLGFGFRGRNIRGAASLILGLGGDRWVNDLSSASYECARAELMTFPGIGDKVADCICLFGFGHDEAAPLDVHMLRVGRRLFPEAARGNSLTTKSYAAMASAFRDHFGNYAGWAQQYLYYNEITRAGLWDEQLGRHRPRAVAGVEA